jgi:hypothetical protein
MSNTVPSASTTIPADLKGPAGSGLAAAKSEETPITLSSGLKEEIQKIINKYAANKKTLTPAEFSDFLKQEQRVMVLNISN